VAGIGLPADLSGCLIQPLKGSVTERVIREDRALLLQGDFQKNGTFASPRDRPTRPHSALAVPLRCGQRILGVINLGRYNAADLFTEADLAALEIVATQDALAVENMRLMDRALENERLATVGRTTADISHCVKNILTSVKGGVFLFHRGLELEAASVLEQALRMLRRSVSRLHNIIADLRT
jgi:GAF domain-containing protein